jgi:tetratricopeptide (TPR) repeat protein
MPTIKELEEFTQTFRTIGNEAGISADRGESYIDLPLPETEPAGDPFANATAPSNSENNQNFDFGAFLDTIPDDFKENTSEENSSNNEDSDENSDFNDGLGDLLSGFADEIEAAQNEPDYPPEFVDNEFDDPNIPGNAIDTEFEELSDFNFPEDSSNIDTTDFGNLDDFSIPEDSSNNDTADFSNLDDFTIPEDSANNDAMDFGDLGDFSIPDNPVDQEQPVISDDEMLSLFSEAPVMTPPEVSEITDLPSIEDANTEDSSIKDADLEDLPSFEESSPEESPLNDDFSFDADSVFSDNIDADFSMDTGLELDPEMPEDMDDTFSGGFDASIPGGGDFGFNVDEDFSIPEMDDDINADSQSSFDDSMDLSGESLDMPSFEMPDSTESETSDAAVEELDSFDSFNLDDENTDSSLSMPETDFNIDEVAFNETGDPNDIGFSLDGIDDIFNTSAEPGKPKSSSKAGDFSSQASSDVEEIQLSQEDVSKLTQTLNSYPLNLRIACEEIIAEQVVAPELMSELIKKLVNGASPKETAALVGKILGKTIQIPKGFLKKTGEELEAEQSSFSYIFVHSFLPVLRTFAIFALLLCCLGFLIHQFIYTPIRAEGIYQRGYELIETGDYARANENFLEALNVRKIKKWFFRYAEAFRDNRQYAFAEEKYDELLRYYPRDKQGALDYAHLQTYNLYNYEKANRILRDNILDYVVDDREGLFAQGENFLAWGEIDPSQLENARVAFARLMEKYGQQDIYLEQMLKYFIRTDNLVQVLPLQNYFLASPDTNITAPTLAELGGYLLDKKFEEVQGVPDEGIEKIEGIRDVLLRSVNADKTLPESHYHLARYYSRYGSIPEEQVVLETAIKAFDAAPELSAKRLGYRIDTQRRYAWMLTSTKYFVNAQESLIKGIDLYEDALNRRVLSPAPDYGRLYSDLADIEYFNDGDFDAALQNYITAEETGWHPPEVMYRMGSIYYHSNRMAEAMERFFEVSNEMPLNRRLLYSLGNTSYLRGNYFAAQGYYNRLLDLLETEKVRATTLLPHDRPEHMELAERIMEVQNNLGVTLGTLADRSGNVNYRTRALALYSESARAWDFITRNPTTLVRLFVPGTEIPETNQSLLNTKYTLYPEPGFEPLIYNQIDMDVEDPSIWESLVPQNTRTTDIPYEIRNE